MAHTTNQQLFQIVLAWIADNYPGEQVEAITLHWRDRGRIPTRLSLPNGAGRPANGDAARAFEPTPFQLGVLDALAGRALKVDALVAAVKDRAKLYRDPGGIKELQRLGLVEHDKRRGYFRPDAPPDEMEDEE